MRGREEEERNKRGSLVPERTLLPERKKRIKRGREEEERKKRGTREEQEKDLPTQSIMYVPFLLSKFQEIILLIIQYKYLYLVRRIRRSTI